MLLCLRQKLQLPTNPQINLEHNPWKHSPVSTHWNAGELFSNMDGTGERYGRLHVCQICLFLSLLLLMVPRMHYLHAAASVLKYT